MSASVHEIKNSTFVTCCQVISALPLKKILKLKLYMPETKVKELKRINLERLIDKFAKNARQFAGILNIDPDRIHKILNVKVSERELSDNLMDLICEKFPVRPREFFFETEEEISNNELKQAFLKIQAVHPYRKERVIKILNILTECDCTPPSNGNGHKDSLTKKRRKRV